MELPARNGKAANRISNLADSVVPVGPRVQASRARDILDRFQRPFAFNKIPVPDPELFQGPEAVACLAETTDTLAEWMIHHV